MLSLGAIADSLPCLIAGVQIKGGQELLELGFRAQAVELTDLLEREAEADARLQEAGAELQGPPAARDRLGVLASIIVHPGLRRLQNGREGVEAPSPVHGLERSRGVRRLGEDERARVVRLGETRVEFERPPELAVRLRLVPVEEQPDEP